MADVIYNRFSANLMNGLLDLEGDTIKCALLTSAYTPDKDHAVFGDVSASEVSGTGYTAGGETLATKAVTQDDTNDYSYFDSDNPIWTTATIIARYAVLYDVTATSNLIAVYDFTEDKSSSAGDFEVKVNAVSGWFKLPQGV